MTSGDLTMPQATTRLHEAEGATTNGFHAPQHWGAIGRPLAILSPERPPMRAKTREPVPLRTKRFEAALWASLLSFVSGGLLLYQASLSDSTVGFLLGGAVLVLAGVLFRVTKAIFMTLAVHDGQLRGLSEHEAQERAVRAFERMLVPPRVHAPAQQAQRAEHLVQRYPLY